MKKNKLFLLFLLVAGMAQMETSIAQEPGSRAIKPDPKMGTIGLKLDQRQPGVTVVEVVPNSSGEKAGFKAGDQIVSLNKKKVKDVQTFMSLRMQYKAGDILELAGTDAHKKSFTRKVKIMPVS